MGILYKLTSVSSGGISIRRKVENSPYVRHPYMSIVQNLWDHNWGCTIIHQQQLRCCELQFSGCLTHDQILQRHVKNHTVKFRKVENGDIFIHFQKLNLYPSPSIDSKQKTQRWRLWPSTSVTRTSFSMRPRPTALPAVAPKCWDLFGG